MSVCGLAGGMHAKPLRRKRTRRLPAVNRQHWIVRQKNGRQLTKKCAVRLALVMRADESRILSVVVRTIAG